MRQHPVYRHISSDKYGNIYFNGKFVEGTITATGYRQYCVNRKSKLGHRLVSECFLGRVLEKSEVINHKNLDRADNAPSNLEIGTQEDNIQHYWRNYGEVVDVLAEVKRPWKAGENHHNARLSLQQVCRMIEQMFEGYSNKQLSEIYGVHERYISLIRHKKRWQIAWEEMGLEGSETIPSGSRAGSKGSLETETSLQVVDYV